MKVQSINDRYFGKDSSKRYLVKALRKCTENLLATEVALRLYDEINSKHACPNSSSAVAICAYCDSYNTLVGAYLDAAYLSARLVFAQKHTALASDFIRDVQELDSCCIEQYYNDAYNHDFVDNGELQELHKLAINTAISIKSKYKTIQDYQTYKFHQPSDQIVSNVTKKVRDMGGYKLNITQNKPKQSNNTKDLLDMLIDLSNLIDRYSHLVSLPNINWEIPVKRVVESTVLLFGVNIDQEKVKMIISETEMFIEPINKMLTCGAGLRNHKRLQFQKISKQAKE